MATAGVFALVLVMAGCGGGGGKGPKTKPATSVQAGAPTLTTGTPRPDAHLSAEAVASSEVPGAAFVPFTSQTPVEVAPGAPARVKGQVVLSFAEPVDPAHAAREAQALGGQLVGVSPDGQFYTVAVSASASGRLALSAPGRAGLVPNLLLEPQGLTDEAIASRDAQAVKGFRQATGYDKASQLLRVAPQRRPKVALLDTGVDTTHPALLGADVKQVNLLDQQAGGLPHGTHMAMLLAGQTTSQFEGGLCTHCEVLSVKVCGQGGCPLSAVLSGLEAAARWGAEVVYLGFGVRGGGEEAREALSLALARHAGAVVLAPSGNDGGALEGRLPASLPGVVAVVATTLEGELWPGSSRGADTLLAAPGSGLALDGLAVSGTSYAGALATAAVGHLASASGPQQALAVLLAGDSQNGLLPVDLYQAHLRLRSGGGVSTGQGGILAPARAGPGAGVTVKLATPPAGAVQWTVDKGAVLPVEGGSARLLLPRQTGTVIVIARVGQVSYQATVQVSEVTPTSLALVVENPLEQGAAAWATALADTREGYRLPVAATFSGDQGVTVNEQGRVSAMKSPGGQVSARSGDLKASVFVSVIKTAALSFTPLAAGDWPVFKGVETRLGVSSENIGPSLIPRWKVDLGGPITASPVVDSTVVFTATETGDVVSLNKLTGAEIWRRAFGGVIGATPAVCGTLLLATVPQKLVAMNRGDGTVAWEFTTHTNGSGNPPENASSPVCDGQKAYFGSLDGNVYGINLVDGSKAWEFATGGQVPGSPALLGNLLAIGSANNRLYLLDTATGTPVWNLGGPPASLNGFAAGGNVISSPAINNGRIVVGVSSDSGAATPFGKVISVNMNDGSLAWSFDTSNWVTASPSVAGGLVYVGDIDFNFYALNETTGALVWARQLGSAILSSPIVVGNVVYVGTDDRFLYALDANSGQTLATFETGARIWSSVAPSQGMLYLTSADRFLYALGAGITPPQNLIAVSEPGQVRLNWNPSTTYQDGNPFTDIGGTDIYRSLSATGPFAIVGSVGPGVPVFVDTAVTAGTQYFYQVQAKDNQIPPNVSAFSNQAQATPTTVVDTKPPSAPTPLTAIAQDGAVLLNWASPATNNDGTPLTDLAGFNVYQSLVAGGPYTLLTQTPITATNYTVSGLVNGTVYFFVVTAVDDKTPPNQSANSQEASATPTSGLPGACVNWRQFGCTPEKTGYTPTIMNPPLVPRWQFQTGAVVGSSPVAIASDTVFAGSEDSYAYALSLNTGAQRWRFKTGGIIQSVPAVGDNVVAFASADGNIYGLDKDNGTQVWRVPTAGPVFGPLAMDGDTVYAGDFSGFVYALNIDTGQNVWGAPAQVNGSIIGGGAVSQGVIYIGSSNGNLNALSTLNGAPVWTPPDLGSNITSTPSIDGDRLYVGTDGGRIYAVSIPGGNVLWQFNTGGLVTSSPSVRNRTVYIGGWDGVFYSVDGETGTELGRFVVGDSILSTAAIANDKVFFGANDGFLYTLDAANVAQQVGRTSLEARVLASPAITSNFLILASDAGRVFAFSTGNQPNPPSSLAASAGDKAVDLSWSAPTLNTDGTPVTDLDSYNIYYAVTANGPYSLVETVDALTTSATITGLVNNTPYFFQVTAVDNENPQNESDKSNIATATPSNKTPAAPVVISATPGDKQVTLTWSAVTTHTDGSTLTDLAGYIVFYGSTPGGPYARYNNALITTTTATVSNLTNGVTYYFVVRAQDNELPTPTESANSPEASARPVGSIPNAPINLGAQAGDTVVILSWSAVTTNTDGTTMNDLGGYDVYVSLTSGGPYTKVNTSNVAATSFTVSNLVNNTPYFFVVRARDRDNPPNQSVNSSEVTATPRGAAPGPPVILYANPKDGAVELAWDAPTTDENGLPLRDLTGYNIYYATASGGPYLQANAAPVNGVTFTVTGLINLQVYYFVVRALDNSTPPVESTNSNEVSAIPNVQYPVYLQGSWYQSGNQEAIPGKAAVSLGAGSVAVLQKRVFDDVGIMVLPQSMYYDQGVVAFRVDGVDRGTLDLKGFEPTTDIVKTHWIAKGLTVPTPFPETEATPNGDLEVSASASVTQFTVKPGNKKVILQWPLNSEGDTFDIYRSQTPGQLYSKLANDFAGTTYIDRTVTNGRTYYYKITATTEHRVEMRVLSGRVGFAGWEVVLQDGRRTYDTGVMIQ